VRLIRVLLPAFAAMALGAAAAVPAAATEPYPPNSPAVSVGTTSPVAGQPFAFTATGFLAAEKVEIAVNAKPVAMRQLTSMRPVAYAKDVINTLTADSSGSVSTDITLTQPGTYTITATGLTSGNVVSTTVTVTGSTDSRDALAVTNGPDGTVVRSMLLSGAAAVLIGAWLVAWMTRRRKAAKLH